MSNDDKDTHYRPMDIYSFYLLQFKVLGRSTTLVCWVTLTVNMGRLHGRVLHCPHWTPAWRRVDSRRSAKDVDFPNRLRPIVVAKELRVL